MEDGQCGPGRAETSGMDNTVRWPLVGSSVAG